MKQNKTKYKIIKLELLVGGIYQRANRPSILAVCDKFTNTGNRKNMLQHRPKHTHHKNKTEKKINY